MEGPAAEALYWSWQNPSHLIEVDSWLRLTDALVRRIRAIVWKGLMVEKVGFRRARGFAVRYEEAFVRSDRACWIQNYGSNQSAVDPSCDDPSCSGLG